MLYYSLQQPVNNFIYALHIHKESFSLEILQWLKINEGVEDANVNGLGLWWWIFFFLYLAAILEKRFFHLRSFQLN